MYLDYHELLKKYKEACRNYNEALEKKSKLILAVIPGSSKIKQVMVDSNTTYSELNLLNYTDEMDEVDKLINQSRNTKDMLNYELKKMENEMKSSNEILDRVYYYKWIEHKKPRQFNRLINYSIPQTYRFIDEIKSNIYLNDKK